MPIYKVYDNFFCTIMGNPKTKSAYGQLKMRSNQRVEENKLGLKLNFTLESKWAGINLDFDYLTELYWASLSPLIDLIHLPTPQQTTKQERTR